MSTSTTTSSSDVPPFIGYVETTVNALRLIHAARQGVIPRITRRLNDTERRTMIKSGAVFVFSVEESGIKRWTDGLLWSPSRIVGNFLVYREINERASSRGASKKPYPIDGSVVLGRSGHSPPSSATDQGTFKPNGLIKKTITVTIEGSDLHLISYYTSEDIRCGRLKRPSARHDIMNIPMAPHIFRLTNFRVPPKVEMGPDGKQRLVTDPEDAEAPCVEPKTEEPSYNLSHSPHSPSTPTTPETMYSSGSYDSYQRSGSDSWPSTATDISRVTSPGRQEYSWSLSPIASPAHSRRDNLNEQAWSMPSTRYESTSTPAPYDRPPRRILASYHPPVSSRDGEQSYRHSSSRHGHGHHRESTVQRLPWVLGNNTDTSSTNGRSDSRGTSCRSYVASPNMPSNSSSYSSVQYTSQYGSQWAASDNANLHVSTPPFGYSAAAFGSDSANGYHHS